MNDMCIHKCHTVQVYEMPYAIGMEQETYRKYNMYRCVVKHEYDMKNENKLKHEHEHERQYVMNT